MDFPTWNDLFAIARDEITARNPRISVDAVQRDGTDANVLVASSAAVGDECVGQLAAVSAALFLDSATGTDLDRLVFDRYGLVRKPAAVALGSVNFSVATANPAAFAIPTGTQVGTSTGQVYVTTQPATFPAGSLGPITVPIRSTLAGSDQQAKANTITSLITQVTGQPANLVVNNPLATAGAVDDETDDALRKRARQFFVNARRGTMGALKAGALAVPGVQTANAFEVLETTGRAGRMVVLVVTDAFTEQLAALGENPPSYQQQSQALAQSVFSGLDDVRPAGIYVDVQVAQVVLLPVILALTFTSSADPVATTQAAIAIIVDYVNGLAPGAPFTYADAVAKLKTISGLVIGGRDIYSPSGDVEPEQLQALRTTTALVVPYAAAPGLALTTTVETP